MSFSANPKAAAALPEEVIIGFIPGPEAGRSSEKTFIFSPLQKSLTTYRKTAF
jgi:hypothetical protein